MSIKKYLPFEDYVLTTALPVDEVYRRLAKNIGPKKIFRLSLSDRSPSTPYEGSIGGNTFKISRIIGYRNSFLPFITGQILNIGGQTQINIKMRPVVAVLIFMSFWLGVVGLVCAAMIIQLFAVNVHDFHNGFSPVALIPFVMFIFGWALCYFPFKTESKGSKKFLAVLLEGQEIN